MAVRGVDSILDLVPRALAAQRRGGVKAIVIVATPDRVVENASPEGERRNHMS